MKNYIFDLYTVSEFKRDNTALAEKAEQALQYLKGYYPTAASSSSSRWKVTTASPVCAMSSTPTSWEK